MTKEESYALLNKAEIALVHAFGLRQIEAVFIDERAQVSAPVDGAYPPVARGAVTNMRGCIHDHLHV